MSAYRVSTPRWMRHIAALCSLSFTGTFVLSTPAKVLAHQTATTHPVSAKPIVSSLPLLHPNLKRISPPKSLRENLRPLSPGEAHKIALVGKNRRGAVGLSLLDDIGHLKGSLLSGQVRQWQKQLHTDANAKLSSLRMARLHLWLGEVRLARDEEPLDAITHFKSAIDLAAQASVKTNRRTRHQAQRPSDTQSTEAVVAAARRDIGFGLFYSGRYAQAAEVLHTLLTSRTPLPGIERRETALFQRHASACAGYHTERSKMGITEPNRLDPLCGVEALAACLRGLHLPYDKKTVRPLCRVTGEGSSLADVIQAANKLKLTTVACQADPTALQALNSPLVAFVEHDHFIALTHADKQGVTYLCSDCGAWPGGERKVTWKQWKAMEAGPYLAVCLPDSPEAQALQFALHPASKTAELALATHTPRTVLASLSVQNPAVSARLAARLAGHLLLYLAPTRLLLCGNKPDGDPCPCEKTPPTDGGGPTTAPPTTVTPDAFSGASAGDPVNLATGEEEYRPGTDLTVYNPVGPSVSWSRIYNSLRASGEKYNSDDMGVGWSHSYNYAVYDTTVRADMHFLQGSTNNMLPSTGTDAPASGLTWDIVQNGTTIASSASPNGWAVSGYYQFTVSIPANAPLCSSYEMRAQVGSNNYFQSGFFDVYAATSTPQVPQGGQGDVSFTGSDVPAAGLTWDIVQNGTTIATSTAPNNWSVTLSSPSAAKVTAPSLAPVGTYEVRYQYYYPQSSPFQVYAVSYLPKPGTRTLIEPNGAQVPINAPSVPTAANPSVVCTLPAGFPMLVRWKYAPGYTCGYYVLTMADRTQMVTTTVSKAVGGSSNIGQTSAILYSLGQIIDRTGNAINFWYGNPGSGNFPMLSAITDRSGQNLLTFTRASDGTGNLTAINDRYGRSVTYHVGTYANVNVGAPNPTSMQELDHVSQVVATGALNPPDRYAYGYQAVNNGEGTEQVPFLHTITVPSPTGAGNATATINYATNGTCYVTSLVDANGNSRNYSATDLTHTLVTVKNPQGATVYSYTAGFDSGMNGISTTNGSGVVQYTKTFADPNNIYRPSSVTNANGNTTSATWDQFGNCLTSTSARGTVTTNTISYTNFALGEVTSIQVGAKIPVTLTYYEPTGLLQSITCAKPGDLSGATIAANFFYDALGNLTQESGPGNNAVTTETTTFNYTSDPAYNYNQAAALRQPLTRTDPLGHVSHFRFDARGNKSAESDALGNEMDIAHNLADQMTTITFPTTGMTGAGHATVGYTYQYVGGPQSQETQTNEAGTLVFQVLTILGPEGETLSRSGTTQPFTATYDALYRMTSMADGNAHAATYAYTTGGYLGKISYPNANVNTGYDIVSFTSFDNLGHTLQRVDGRGVVTNFVYDDPENKLTDLQYPATPGINVHIAYDAYGRRQSRSDGSGSQAWSYDFNDLLLTATTTYTGLPAQTLTYAYNPDESCQSMRLPDGTSFGYSYDAATRLTSLQNPSGQTWNWSYLNNDWLSQQMDATRVTVNYTRNARGILTSLANTTTSGGSTLSSYTVNGYTPGGSVAQIVSSLPAASALGGTTNYTQDTRSEMTHESSTVGSGYTLNCAYDAAENPTTFRGAAQSFNADNQNSANVYDGSGNPTTYKGTTTTFDAENRLNAFGTAMTSGYRGDGLRASKTTASGTTYFIYDVDRPVLEVNASGTKTAVTTFGPSGVLARTTATRTLLYTSDSLGNVSQQVDASSGSVVASYAFDSFGGRLVNSSDPTATSDPYSGYGGTTGYFTDWETGLQLLGHRFYDSTSGRFLNRDPMDTDGGVNVYGYVSNDPLDMSDPTGYWPQRHGGPHDGGLGNGGAGGNTGPGKGGGGSAGGTAGLGCLAGMVGALVGDVVGGGGLNLAGFCSIIMGCFTGALCGLIGSIVALAGPGVGCFVGILCGIGAAVIGLACSAAACPPPSPENIVCQIATGGLTGCLGGAIPGPWGGWIGSIAGGFASGLCNRLVP